MCLHHKLIKNTKKCYYSLIIVISNGSLCPIAPVPLQNRSHSPISSMILDANTAGGNTESLKITSFLCFNTFHNTTMNFVAHSGFPLAPAELKWEDNTQVSTMLLSSTKSHLFLLVPSSTLFICFLITKKC